MSVVRVVLNVNVRVSKTAIREQLTHSLQAIPTGQVFQVTEPVGILTQLKVQEPQEHIRALGDFDPSQTCRPE